MSRAITETQKAAARARARAWKVANPARMKALKAAHYAANRDRLLKEMKTRYHAHKAEAREKYVLKRDELLARAKKYRTRNLETYRQRDRATYWRTRSTVLARVKVRRVVQSESVRERDRRAYARNREMLAVKRAALLRTPNGKITTAVRNTMRRIVTNGAIKSARSVYYLGCSIAEARAYIEAQFQPGMTWDNHGIYGWHIDHKRPLASFNLSDPEEARAASRYTNLKPLWAYDNLSKGRKYEGFIRESAVV